MRNNSRAQLLDQLLKRMIEDDLDLGDIRKELDFKRIESDERKIIIDYLSRQHYIFENLKARKAIGQFSIIGGGLALLLGIVVTIAFFGMNINLLSYFYSGYKSMALEISVMVGTNVVGLIGIGFGMMQIKAYKDFLSRNKIEIN